MTNFFCFRKSCHIPVIEDTYLRSPLFRENKRDTLSTAEPTDPRKYFQNENVLFNRDFSLYNKDKSDMLNIMDQLTQKD